MAVVDSRETEYVEFKGLSTDTKPTGSGVPIGSTFKEIDTTKYYEWSGTEWKFQVQLEED